MLATAILPTICLSINWMGIIIIIIIIIIITIIIIILSFSRYFLSILKVLHGAFNGFWGHKQQCPRASVYQGDQKVSSHSIMIILLVFCQLTEKQARKANAPRCSSGANAGGRAFCHKLDIGWVHIVQWIFSILAISAGLFWRKSVFCVFTL